MDLWLDRNYEPGEAQAKAADALEYAVSDLLELVVIDLGTADDPHIIFETLNARGTPLLQSEMIKTGFCMKLALTVTSVTRLRSGDLTQTNGGVVKSGEADSVARASRSS